MFPKLSVPATSKIPPKPNVILTRNLPIIFPILSLFSWRIALAKLIGVFAVVAKLERGFLGMSGISLQPLATGLKK